MPRGEFRFCISLRHLPAARVDTTDSAATPIQNTARQSSVQPLANVWAMSIAWFCNCLGRLKPP